MFRSKPYSVVFCLLCAALPALAQKPDGKGVLSSDSSSRANLQQYQQDNIPSQVGGKSLEQWRKDLTNQDPSVRAAAVLAVPNFGPGAGKVVADLLPLLRDRDCSPRAKVAKVLEVIRPFVSPADKTRVIHALGRAIQYDDQLIIRYQAAVAYKAYCPINHAIKEEHETIYNLVSNVGLIQSSTFELRDACIEALILAGVDQKVGPDPRVTAALIRRADFQNEPTTQVRLKAIMGLGAMGRPQSPGDYQKVMDVLKSPKNYKSTHPTVRIWSHVAIIALDEKADKKDLDTIAGFLQDRTAEVKYQAVTALGALEDKAQAYVPNLCDMVLRPRGEDDPQVLAGIAISLGRMDNKGARVKKALVQMTEHDDQKFAGVVMEACKALALLGLNDGEASNAIKKALEHRSLNAYQKALLQAEIENASKAKKPVKIATPKKNDPAIGRGGGNPQQNRR
jgi:HEAT repeat protein